MATKKKATPAPPATATGFKVTDPDGSCRGFQYALGQDYTLPDAPVLCESGFHFCALAADCFNYYSFNPENRVFAVEAFGAVVSRGDKSATNGLRLVREYTWLEVLGLVNQGKDNTGQRNSGDRNSGNRNSGDWNSGNRNSGDRNSGDRNSGDRNSGNLNSGNRNSGNLNSGDWNSGDWNSGDWNSGDRNSGDWNSGDRNSGDRNSGDLNSGNRNSGNLNSGDWNSGNRNSGNLNSGNLNSGDWNSGDRNSGIFCTTTPTTVQFFDQPSTWSYQDWRDSEAYYLKSKVVLNEWRSWSAMSDAEKEAYPRAETAEGYLLRYEYKAAHRTWWGKLDKRQRLAITGLPNFSWAVFTNITGIAEDAA